MSAFSAGFAGMTHLGLISAVGAAEKGFDVICFDADRSHVAGLCRGELQIVEPQLRELLTKNSSRIRFTNKVEDLRRCALVYIAPDIPTDNRGTSDLVPLLGLLDQIESALTPDAVSVILSQVPPGFTRRRLRSGRELYYQVETLIFGRAVERTLRPERFIVGCADPGRPLPHVLQHYLASYACPILPMRYESAELAKISINMCLVASVSVANMMAEVCERVGADWNEIVPSLRLDRRIGQHAYIDAGLGLAGGNLERDVATVCRLAAEYGSDSSVAQAWFANSAYRKTWPLRVLHDSVLRKCNDPQIAILGLAYKENTASTKNSAALALIQSLKPFRVCVYDPAVAADLEWHPALTQKSNALDACERADVVCLMTPWPEFTTLSACAVAERMKGNVVIDPYRLIDTTSARSCGLLHFSLGF